MTKGPGARRLTAEWWLVALLSSLLVLVLTETRAMQRVDHLVYDQLLRLSGREPDPRILLVSIDTMSLQQTGRWPWPRNLHARLIDQLNSGRPRAIAYDVLFLEAARSDAELATSMRAGAPVFLPLLLDAPGHNGAAFDPVLPVPELAGAAAGLGHVNLHTDPDGLIRRIRPAEQDAERSWAHLMTHVAQRAEGHTSVAGQREVLIPFSGPPGTYPSVSATQVLSGQLPPELLANRIVLVGASAQGLGDRHAVPRGGPEGVMSGIELQANVLDGLLNGRLVTPASGPAQALFGLIPLWILLLGYRALRPRSAAILLAAVLLGVLCSCVLAFVVLRSWIPPAPTLAALLIVSPLWAWRRLAGVSAYMLEELARLRREPDFFSPRAASPAADPLMEETLMLSGAIEGMRATRRFIHESLDQLPDAIFVVTPDGRIVLTNRRAERLCEELGHPVRASFRDLSGLFELPADSGSARLWPPQHTSARAEAVAPDGRIFDILATARDEDRGEFPGWIIRMSDISATRLAQRQRDEMLRFLTHDMRSPQASILALTSSAEPEQIEARLARRIDRYARRTLDLADGIVHLARAELLTYEPAALSLSELVEDALDELWPQIRKKRMHVDVVGGELELSVEGEGSLLTRALINLIDNAVKYSPAGSRLEFLLHSEQSDVGDQAVCTIKDEGHGIAAEQLARLFQRFQRGGASNSGVEGVGLGLSFVETVVHRHGGTVSCESVVGKGSTFIVRLPLAN